MQVGPYKTIGPSIPTLWGNVTSPYVMSAPSLLRQPMVYPSLIAERPNPLIAAAMSGVDEGNYVEQQRLPLALLPNPRTDDPRLNFGELKRIMLEARRIVSAEAATGLQVAAIQMSVDTALGLIDRLISNGVSYDHLVNEVIEQSSAMTDEGLDQLRQQLEGEIQNYLTQLAVLQGRVSMAPNVPTQTETSIWPWLLGGVAVAAIGFYFWR